MSREFVVTPLGLMTQANKIGVYPQGAMSRADGLVMRSPGYVEPFKRSTSLISPPVVASASSYNLRVFPIGNGMSLIVRATGTSLPLSVDVFFGNSAATLIGATPESQQFNRARAAPFIFRNRLFAMSPNGLMAWDSTAPTTLAERTARWGQLLQPSLSVSPTGSGSALNTLTAASYACVLRRVYADGYELTSAPSPIVRARNSTGAIGPVRMDIRWASPTGAADRPGVLAGDIIEVYRSKEASAPTAGLNVNPGTTLFLVKTFVITAAHIAANGISNQQDTAEANKIVGREMYTNPGAETLQSSRFIPPISKCMADFKGFVFYGNVTQPGSWIGAYPGGYGNLAAGTPGRLNGIGFRDGTGTFTSGSNVITVVSAADIVGVVIGQNITVSGPPTLPPFTTVTAVGATTITMSNPVTGSGTVLWHSQDVVEIDGIRKGNGDAGVFTGVLSGSGNNLWYNIVIDEPMLYLNAGSGVEVTYGQRMQWEPYRATQNSNSITVRGTNENNYDPPIPAIGATAQTFSAVPRKNLLYWSWEQEPESVSPATYAFIGSGEIYALATTRDVMWLFASDGLWRFTGYGTRPSGIAANFRVDLIDRTLVLAGPNAFTVLRDAVFAYTNIGLVKISDAVGVQPITRGIIGDLLPGRGWVESEDITLAADEILDEIWINVLTGDLAANTTVVKTYVWQDQYGIFTILNQNTTSTAPLMTLAFDRSLSAMLQGIGQRASVTGPHVEWHDPAQTTYEACAGDYQPLYGPDPLSSKQWVDMAVVFDPGSAGQVCTPRFNGIAYASETIILYPNTLDARANIGVDINAPAVANLLAPGYSMIATVGITRMRALSMRFVAIDEQQVFR